MAFEKALKEKEKRDLQAHLAAIQQLEEAEYDALSQSAREVAERFLSQARLASKLERAEQEQLAAAEANRKLEEDRLAQSSRPGLFQSVLCLVSNALKDLIHSIWKHAIDSFV